ncbi:MAG TPA: hypothetical protein VF067_02455 [Sphingomicrobium sp.]
MLAHTNGAMLSRLPDAWQPLLNPFPWREEVAEGLRDRGRLLFAVGGQILGDAEADIESSGALWSLVDGAQHCTDAQSRMSLLAEARDAIGRLPARIPARLRPLTVLAALGAADALARGRLARAAAALRHRLTGTFPRG